MVMVGTLWNLEVYRTNYCWYGCLKRWYGIHKTFGYILFPLTKSCLKSEPEEKGPPKIWSPVMFVASISSFYPPFAKRRILRKLRQHLAISLELTFLLALLAFIGMKIELLIAWGWHDFDLTWTHWLTQGKYGYLTRIDLLLYCYILGMNRMYTTHSKNCSWFYHITSGIPDVWHPSSPRKALALPEFVSKAHPTNVFSPTFSNISPMKTKQQVDENE